MEWKTILDSRLRAKRQILFSKEDVPELTALTETLPRQAVILWALELAEETAQLLEQESPDGHRAALAVAMARLWASGEIKMPVAKRAILDCHAAAKNARDPRQAALFHAVGQACSTVHTVRHGVGFPIYALTALVRETGTQDCGARIEARLAQYRDRLLYWSRHYRDENRSWAAFLKEE